MYTLEHIPEQSGAYRWASFSRAGAFSLAVILLAVGCGQEATAPQHPGLTSLQVVSASKPIQQFHDHVTGSFSADIFCGIPADIEFALTNNFFLYADGSFKVTTSTRYTITNPENGKSVLVSLAGVVPSGAAPIVDAEAGTITFITSFKGLPLKLQAANGSVLLRDAGIITFADTFDLVTGEFISSEIIVNKGPHPHGDSDFTLFCEVLSSALT
jgi:hypothetical protein